MQRKANSLDWFTVFRTALILLTFLALPPHPMMAQGEPSKDLMAAPNVLLVTIDGLRWQEVFGGADETLINKEKDSGGVKDLEATSKRFMRSSAEERRRILMPFLWKTISSQGVIMGDPEAGSKAVVTNGLNFSYPGYSEILCGFADPAIDSNAKQNNTNTTVLEWIHRQSGFSGRIAAFCSWDVFPFIINEKRSGIPVNAGWEPLASMLSGDSVGPPASGDGLNAEINEASVLSDLQALDELSLDVPRYWPEVRYDYFTFKAAETYIRHRRPRVMYVSLGETDDWAHAGRYDLYLDATQRNDAYIERLWTLLQSLPEYRNNTTLIITTDHGRGDNRIDWKSHGKDIADCQYIWMAAIGPTIEPSTTNPNSPAVVTQAQIAATVAASLGLDYCANQPKAGAPLPIFRK